MTTTGTGVASLASLALRFGRSVPEAHQASPVAAAVAAAADHRFSCLRCAALFRHSIVTSSVVLLRRQRVVGVRGSRSAQTVVTTVHAAYTLFFKQSLNVHNTTRINHNTELPHFSSQPPNYRNEKLVCLFINLFRV